ncbi:hypothetical protein [Phreatobacter oligotrophus]|jgi:hypothetical protein|uniref:hypothetical protein n=1 Tax=Phreatobacter oligotrophus TaxID=1122261 RepID=UPI002356AE22|nr:hypothetical protein [Phreatobacter oligotrophus]MBX9992530.1 hypothetical protein [Phreatobacter oligotrophus]
MQRLLKFGHSMGAIGLMGALACLLVLDHLAPPPSDLKSFALMRGAMAEITNWILLPSLILTLIPGLIAIAATPAFHNAGWVWAKAASGILVFAGGLHAIGPLQDLGRQSTEALAGRIDVATLSAGIAPNEAMTLWILLAVSTANVVLAIWRGRILR